MARARGWRVPAACLGAAALCLAGIAAASPVGATPARQAATHLATGASRASGLIPGPLPPPASTLQQITGFGPNPTNLQMYLYVPQHLRPHPAVVVALHYCGGTGPAFFNGTEYASLADIYGYIVVYPSVTRTSLDCFDVEGD